MKMCPRTPQPRFKLGEHLDHSVSTQVFDSRYLWEFFSRSWCALLGAPSHHIWWILKSVLRMGPSNRGFWLKYATNILFHLCQGITGVLKWITYVYCQLGKRLALSRSFWASEKLSEGPQRKEIAIMWLRSEDTERIRRRRTAVVMQNNCGHKSVFMAFCCGLSASLPERMSRIQLLLKLLWRSNGKKLIYEEIEEVHS